MRAARLYGPGDIRVAGEPAPAPGPDEVLVTVTAVGICGSDLHWWGEGAIGDAALTRPLVLGHEAAAIIASGPRRGQRVAIDPAIPCLSCRACDDGYRNLCPSVVFAGHGTTDGAMREQMAWPASRLHPLPESLSDSEGALLEPLGVAIHCMDLGHLPLGGNAAVIGCGPIGLLLVQLLRVAGAGSVLAIDPLPHRREAAARLGATATSEPPPWPAGSRSPSAVWLPELTGYGVDVAFEAAGAREAVQTAIEATRPGGRVVLAGIPGDDSISFSASIARRKGLTIALARRMNEVYPRAIAMACRDAVDLASLVTDALPLGSAAEALTMAAERTGLKVVVEPQRLHHGTPECRRVRRCQIQGACGNPVRSPEPRPFAGTPSVRGNPFRSQRQGSYYTRQ